MLIVLARQYAAVHHVAAQRPPLASFQIHRSSGDAAPGIADYAAELAVTPGHLSVLCTQYAGQGAKRLLDSTLASRARRMLLYTDESAARVGASLGFEDPSYFSRFFRRETGQTPKEFRNALRR
jgi:AraC-like DNA-binding protein